MDSIKQILLKGLFLFFLTFTLGLTSFAQLNRSSAIGAYIYNFAKLSDSPKQESLAHYNIALITSNQEIKDEFLRMQKDLKIRNKNIELTLSEDGNEDFKNTCLLFIGEDKDELYSNLFKRTKNQEILLVTQNYDNKREILLNLYETEDGNMLFEINKGNIYERGIEINDEILLIGGTEIDLVELYLDSQKKLIDSERKLSDSKTKLLQSQETLKTASREARLAKEQVAQQKKLLEKQTKESQELNNRITDYNDKLEDHKKDFKASNRRLMYMNDSLSSAQKTLLEFKKEIDETEKFLLEKEQQVQDKEEILATQNLTIQKQRYTVMVFIIGTSVISLLLILLLRDFKVNKKKNIVLQEQRYEILEKSNVLEDYNKEIEEINEELNKKNDALSSALKELKQIQNQLVQSEKMASLGVLSAGIAHEINNPINFVYAGINSLLRDFQDIEPVIKEVSKINPETENIEIKLKEIRKLKEENYFDEAFEAIPTIINDIKLGADRTAEIVKGLKSFSRTDKGDLQVLNVHEGLDTSLLLLKNKYKDHIEITKDYDVSIPHLKCYPGKINQAFLNILSNAIESIDKNGQITISTRKEKDNIIISIKDNGVGIPESIKEKLFDPFFTTKPVGKGTGLGLSITYGIIREHGGDINIQSRLDVGSEFIISLPQNSST